MDIAKIVRDCNREQPYTFEIVHTFNRHSDSRRGCHFFIYSSLWANCMQIMTKNKYVGSFCLGMAAKED